MIMVCTNHVKKALKMIDLPHVHPLSDEEFGWVEKECQLCEKKADYKLFNFLQQKKHITTKL